MDRYTASPHDEGMTKADLMAILTRIPGNPRVLIFDPESADWEPLTGCTYGDQDSTPIKLYSDEP